MLSAHPGEERELQRGEESKRAAMAEERVSLGVAGGGVDEEARRCQPQDFGSMNRGDLRKAARDLGVKQRSRSKKELVEECKRATMQKGALLAYTSRPTSNEAPGQAAHAAPVSDSVELFGQAASAKKPKWLRKGRLQASAKAARRSRGQKPDYKAAERSRRSKPDYKAAEQAPEARLQGSEAQSVASGCSGHR